MSRVGEQKFLARWWGVYFLYFVVMGSLGVASAHLGSSLSKKVYSSASEGEVDAVRAVSRVERHASLKVPPHLDAVHSPARPVTAMVRPDIHPAVLAASLDRAEEADAPPVENLSPKAHMHDTIRVAACTLPACNPTRVKGWKKTVATNTSLNTGLKPGQKLLRVAARKVASKSKTSLTAQALSIRTKTLPQTVAADEAAANATSVSAAAKRSFRLALTPGELIRRSLSGTS